MTKAKAKTKSNPDMIHLSLEKKPGLKKLLRSDPAAFRELVGTMVDLAERAASADEPWHTLPSKFDDNLTFRETMTAVADSFFDVESISPSIFSVLGSDVHPMSLFRSKSFGGKSDYAKWRKHFGAPEGTMVNGNVIKGILRQLYYYARYIDIPAFGQAMMANQIEAHRALGLPNAEKLVFYPALKYQKNTFGDLYVGRFWTEIGSFYGGSLPESVTTCPACAHEKLERIGEFKVCSTCNMGFKMVE